MGEGGKDTVITLEDFPFICRICCLWRNDLRLFEEEKELLHLFMTIRNIDVSTVSNFPRNICDECVNKLLDISVFADKMKNDTRLRERERANTDKCVGEISKTCRMCSCADSLTPFREKKSLVQEFQTIAKINVESVINIASGDLICNSCIDKLEAILSFNNKSRCNEETLKNIIGKNKSTNTKIPSDSIDADLALGISVDGAEQIIDVMKEDLLNCNNATLAPMVEWTKEKYDVDDIKEGIINSDCEKRVSMFQTGDKKNVHSRSHTGERSYKCGQCPKTYTNKSHLTRHMLSHTGEKPYKCGHCSKSFSAKETLQNHMFNHTGEKPYKCGHCSEGFDAKQKLQNHMFNHTGEKPYKCGHCAKAFRLKRSLLEHVFIHSEDLPFKCDRCNKSFNRKNCFKRHLHTHDVKK